MEKAVLCFRRQRAGLNHLAVAGKAQGGIVMAKACCLQGLPLTGSVLEASELFAVCTQSPVGRLRVGNAKPALPCRPRFPHPTPLSKSSIESRHSFPRSSSPKMCLEKKATLWPVSPKPASPNWGPPSPALLPWENPSESRHWCLRLVCFVLFFFSRLIDIER